MGLTLVPGSFISGDMASMYARDSSNPALRRYGLLSERYLSAVVSTRHAFELSPENSSSFLSIWSMTWLRRKKKTSPFPFYFLDFESWYRSWPKWLDALVNSSNCNTTSFSNWEVMSSNGRVFLLRVMNKWYCKWWYVTGWIYLMWL